MTIRFSVFIPIWNSARWLPSAIESVLAQTYPHWELIIGDNDSSEDLEEIVRRYPDERIRYHRWATHTEIFENFNRTMTLSRHEWVQILCADDRLRADCLKQMARRIELASQREGRLVAVIGGCRRIDPDGRPAQAKYSYQRVVSVPDGLHDARSWLKYAAEPGIAPWNVGAVAMPRDLLDEMGGYFRPDVGLGSDVELVMRGAAYGDIDYIAEPLLDCTVWGASNRTAQAIRNRERNDPLTPMGAAYLSALRAHQARRTVAGDEVQAVYKAVARSHLQRAVLHQYHSGGGGRRAALFDIGRAAMYSPTSILDPAHLGYALVALFAPRGLVDRGRDLIARRRHERPHLRLAEQEQHVVPYAAARTNGAANGTGYVNQRALERDARGTPAKARS